MVEAVSNFIDPFTAENKGVLYCLSSGAPSANNIQQDLLSVDKMGEDIHKEFVKERLIDKSKSFNP